LGRFNGLVELWLVELGEWREWLVGGG
jgi:hypothetical protein